MALYKRVNGFLWPERDTHCAEVIFGSVKDIKRAVKHVAWPQVCVQAGGNCGVWAKRLSEIFELVYTFEPDHDNFRCLVENVDAENVYKFQCALGRDHGAVQLTGHPKNCGAYQTEPGGVIPVLRIDDLKLSRCNLIILDIEGDEFRALEGAAETIAAYRPVLMYEDKGLSQKHRIKKGFIEKWATGFGYSVVDRVNRDVILAC